MAGCSRCHNLNVMVLPIKDYSTGKIEPICPKCLTDNEMEMVRLIIKDAYEKGKGL